MSEVDTHGDITEWLCAETCFVVYSAVQLMRIVELSLLWFTVLQDTSCLILLETLKSLAVVNSMLTSDHSASEFAFQLVDRDCCILNATCTEVVAELNSIPSLWYVISTPRPAVAALKQCTVLRASAFCCWENFDILLHYRRWLTQFYFALSSCNYCKIDVEFRNWSKVIYFMFCFYSEHTGHRRSILLCTDTVQNFISVIKFHGEAVSYCLLGECSACSALTLLVGWQEGRLACKNWVVGCWHGYLSGVSCRLAYGPTDATATHCLLLQ